MKNFKNSLSRTEMKTIYAGHGGGTGPLPFSEGGKCDACSSHSDCNSGVCMNWRNSTVCPEGKHCL